MRAAEDSQEQREYRNRESNNRGREEARLKTTKGISRYSMRGAASRREQEVATNKGPTLESEGEQRIQATAAQKTALQRAPRTRSRHGLANIWHSTESSQGAEGRGRRAQPNSSRDIDTAKELWSRGGSGRRNLKLLGVGIFF